MGIGVRLMRGSVYVHTSRVFNYNSDDRNVAHIFKGEKIYERHGTKQPIKLRIPRLKIGPGRYSLKTSVNHEADRSLLMRDGTRVCKLLRCL